MCLPWKSELGARSEITLKQKPEKNKMTECCYHCERQTASLHVNMLQFVCESRSEYGPVDIVWVSLVQLINDREAFAQGS